MAKILVGTASWTDARRRSASWTGASWTGASWTGTGWTGTSWTGTSWSRHAAARLGGLTLDDGGGEGAESMLVWDMGRVDVMGY